MEIRMESLSALLSYKYLKDRNQRSLLIFCSPKGCSRASNRDGQCQSYEYTRFLQ